MKIYENDVLPCVFWLFTVFHFLKSEFELHKFTFTESSTLQQFHFFTFFWNFRFVDEKSLNLGTPLKLGPI